MLTGLATGVAVLFVICIVIVFAFEFVNGFHDTANAVATVIYTGTLKPTQAVVWSGIINFLGVLTSVWLFGMSVAFKIAALLPLEALMDQSLGQAIAMVLAVLIAAVAWNLGTWYLGIPCSSSHTLIGSILGVGMVFSFLPENSKHVGINWEEAAKIGNALLFSPAFGFSMAIVLMFILRSVVKNKAIFKEPEEGSRPPVWIRAILITTCTLVSFFHGSNDGQKGVGLLFIILMVFMPLQHALSPEFTPEAAMQTLTNIQAALPNKDQPEADVFKEISKTSETIETLKADIAVLSPTDVKGRLAIRKRMSFMIKNLKVLKDEPNAISDASARKVLSKEMKNIEKYTNHIPMWCMIMISLALGLGTMIGYQRIVVTIGEKIGKRHMTYAEGATAELIAASTIGLSSYFGLPVSTTHVLSSGVAGSMVASKGVKNLQSGTIKNIALAWVLTLPATIILSGGFYLLFRLFA